MYGRSFGARADEGGMLLRYWRIELRFAGVIVGAGASQAKACATMDGDWLIMRGQTWNGDLSAQSADEDSRLVLRDQHSHALDI
jgi:hypothetical protein